MSSVRIIIRIFVPFEKRDSVYTWRILPLISRPLLHPHTYKHTHVHTPTRIHVHTYKRKYAPQHARTHIHTRTHVSTYVRTHVHTHTHTHTYVQYACTNMHTHAHTHARKHARTHACTHTMMMSVTIAMTWPRQQEKQHTMLAFSVFKWTLLRLDNMTVEKLMHVANRLLELFQATCPKYLSSACAFTSGAS